MSSANTNKHKIHATATVSDNSGGFAYAFALDQNPDSIGEIKQMIQQNKLTTGHMFAMGTFLATATTLSVDVDSFVKWGTIVGSETPQANNYLVSFDDSSDPTVGQYYMFVYAVDPYKNITILPHPQNPIKMTTETIQLNFVTANWLSAPDRYAEQRNNVSDATVTRLQPFFDFYNNQTDKLYANISVDPKDSVVNDVSVVAFSSQISNVSDFTLRTKIYNIESSPIFEGVKDDFGEIPIDKYFTGIGDTVGTSFEGTTGTTPDWYGQTFYVYVVMRDIGFDKWIVNEFEVTAGVAPVLTDSTAEIVPTN